MMYEFPQNKRMWWLLVLPVLFACGKPQSPQFIDIDHFKLQNAGGSVSVVSADLKCFNPNSYKISVKHSELNFYIQNMFLGKSVSDSLIVIPASDTFYVPVTMTIDMKNILSNAFTSLLMKEVLIKVEGTAKVGKSGIYKNVPIFYEGKQALNFLD
jgi:LEA14-like dessication related protein